MTTGARDRTALTVRGARSIAALLVVSLLLTATPVPAWASSGNITTVAVSDVSPATAVPGTGRVPILSFRITPAAADTFESVTVRFTGTSTADVASVLLYQEAGSVPGSFSASGDTLRGSTTTEVAGRYTIDPANFSLTAGVQLQFYVVTGLAADATVGHAIDFTVETDGIVLGSGTWPPASETASGTWDPAGATTIDLGLFSGHRDIGAVGAVGSTSLGGGTYTLNASGVGIGGSADEFRYLYRPVTGDARITVRVASQENTDAWAKAGPMFRESLTAGSRHAYVATTPLVVTLLLLQSSNGVGFGWRSATGGTTNESAWTGSTSHVSPYWLRLTRIGDTFTAERSGDGSSWTAVGTPQTVVMASTVYVGLANTSHADGTLNTSSFDNVSIVTPPSAVNDAWATDEDTPLTIAAPGVLANDTDAEGASLSVGTPRPLSGPANGSLTLNANGSFTYTPNANFNGTDSFTYTAHDGTFNSAAATVSVAVTAVNDAPSFTKGGDESVLEGAGAQSVPGWATGMSTGPADESGQALAFLVESDRPDLFAVPPAISPSGTLTYTPASDAAGSATVTVRARDDGGTANGGVDTSAPQTFTIAVSDGNDAPVNGVPPAQSTLVDTPLVFSSDNGNAISISDPDAGAAPVQVALAATNGTLTLPTAVGLTFSVGDGVADSAMTFTGSIAAINAALDGLAFIPAAGYVGSAALAVTTDDLGNSGGGGARSDADSVSITVLGAAPVAADDDYATPRDTTLVVAADGILANDVVALDQPLTVAAPRPVSGPFNGSLTLNADGSFTYAPNPGFDGVDSFTYRATNGVLESDVATVTITVNSGYVATSGWPTAFAPDRYLDLAFPPYVAPGSTVTKVELRHSYRSAIAGDTTCYYVETWRGAVRLDRHGSAESPVSCNGGSSYVTDVIALSEVDSADEANELTVRLFVASSGGGRSAHRLAELAVTSHLDASP